MPSFSRMLARCRSTVLTEITSSAAISLEVCPSAMSLTTSSSRSVSTSNSPPSRSVLLTKSRTSAVTAEGYRKDSPRMAARHASTMSRSAPDFSTYPEAPARSASNRNCSLSYIDSITICRPGRRRASSRAACKPDIRGMATSRITRPTSPAKAFSTASAPSAASATTSKSGSRFSSSASPRRTTAWSSATRTLVGGASRITFPPGPARSLEPRRRHPPPIIDHPTPDPALPRPHRQLHAGGARVAGDIVQALLHDPIQRQLHVTVKFQQLRREPALHLDARARGKRPRQRPQRAHQPQMLQQLRPQLLRDTADLLKAAPDRLLGVSKLPPAFRHDRILQPRQQHQHPGHGLPDLVVQLAGDPLAFGLLRRHRPTAALAPLRLQPLQHLVERRHQGQDLSPRGHREALTRTKQVHVAHPPGQPLQRLERRPQQQGVGDQHRDQPKRQHDRRGQRDRPAHRERRHPQNNRRHHQQRGIRHEHSPKQ